MAKLKTKQKKPQDFWKVPLSPPNNFRKVLPHKRKASIFITCIPPDLEAAALVYPTAPPSFVLVYWSLLFLLKPFLLSHENFKLLHDTPRRKNTLLLSLNNLNTYFKTLQVSIKVCAILMMECLTTTLEDPCSTEVLGWVYRTVVFVARGTSHKTNTFETKSQLLKYWGPAIRSNSLCSSTAPREATQGTRTRRQESGARKHLRQNHQPWRRALRGHLCSPRTPAGPAAAAAPCPRVTQRLRGRSPARSAARANGSSSRKTGQETRPSPPESCERRAGGLREGNREAGTGPLSGPCPSPQPGSSPALPPRRPRFERWVRARAAPAGRPARTGRRPRPGRPGARPAHCAPGAAAASPGAGRGEGQREARTQPERSGPRPPGAASGAPGPMRARPARPLCAELAARPRAVRAAGAGPGGGLAVRGLTCAPRARGPRPPAGLRRRGEEAPNAPRRGERGVRELPATARTPRVRRLAAARACARVE